MKRRTLAGIVSFIPLAVLTVIEGGALKGALAAALLHEAGHLACAFAMGRPVVSMSLDIGGATIKASGSDMSVWRDVAVLLSGPVVNIIVWAMARGCESGFIRELALGSLVLGVFNLIPVRGLDGGGVLQVILDRLLLPRTSFVIQKSIFAVTVLTIWFFAVLSIIFTQGNVSLYLVFLALFLAGTEYFG